MFRKITLTSIEWQKQLARFKILKIQYKKQPAKRKFLESLQLLTLNSDELVHVSGFKQQNKNLLPSKEKHQPIQNKPKTRYRIPYSPSPALLTSHSFFRSIIETSSRHIKEPRSGALPCRVPQANTGTCQGKAGFQQPPLFSRENPGAMQVTTNLS